MMAASPVRARACVGGSCARSRRQMRAYRPGRGRGLTLVEMLVTFALLAVVAGGMGWLLAATKGTWQGGIAGASVASDLQVGLSRIEAELRSSDALLLTDGTKPTGANPLAFSFPSAYDASGTFVTDATGIPVWQKFVVYYIPIGTTNLMRTESYVLPSVPPVQQISSTLFASCLGGRLVASNVTGLTLTSDAVYGGWTVGLSLSGTNANGDIDALSQTLYVAPLD